MHPVGSYCTDISRCTVNKTINVIHVYLLYHCDPTGQYSEWRTVAWVSDYDSCSWDCMDWGISPIAGPYL